MNVMSAIDVMADSLKRITLDKVELILTEILPVERLEGITE